MKRDNDIAIVGMACRFPEAGNQRSDQPTPSLYYGLNHKYHKALLFLILYLENHLF